MKAFAFTNATSVRELPAGRAPRRLSRCHVRRYARRTWHTARRVALEISCMVSDPQGDTPAGSKSDQSAPSTPSPPQAAGNQFSQFDSRDADGLRVIQADLESQDRVDAHRYVFIATESQSVFEKAAMRHAQRLIQQGGDCGVRFVIAKSCMDPTFGYNRGKEPKPLRYCIFQSFASREDGISGVEATTKWLDAVDRIGAPLSPRVLFGPEGAHVSAWVRHESQRSPSFDLDEHLEPDFFVATEVLNANWTSKKAVFLMREKLEAYARYLVSRGNVLAYDVLQSKESPTCFKTFEVYRSMRDLKRHMETDDPGFADEMMEWRAAVNRVRQLYKPLVAFFNYSKEDPMK